MSKNVHDKTFAQLLSERSFFIGFLKTYLPQDIQDNIDWDSVKLYKMGGQHVEEKTQHRFVADVIYLAQVARETGMLWIHFEHQTTPDRFMLLRTINYQTAELLHYAKINKTKKLPPIISLIYYQGNEPYPHDLELTSLFEPTELGVKYFAKPILIDLPSISDDLLKKHSDIGAIELVFKYIRSKTFSKNYRGIIENLQQVDDLNTRKIMLRYLIESSDIQRETILKTMLEYLPKDKGIIMTVADQLRQEGMHEAKLEIARELFLQGFTADEVCKITKLPTEEVVHLEKTLH